MNFIDTMASVELVLAANQVPLLVGETGIGKTSLAAVSYIHMTLPTILRVYFTSVGVPVTYKNLTLPTL